LANTDGGWRPGIAVTADVVLHNGCWLDYGGTFEQLQLASRRPAIGVLAALALILGVGLDTAIREGAAMRFRPFATVVMGGVVRSHGRDAQPVKI